jgi:hypothetical protein
LKLNEDSNGTKLHKSALVFASGTKKPRAYNNFARLWDEDVCEEDAKMPMMRANQ